MLMTYHFRKRLCVGCYFLDNHQIQTYFKAELGNGY